MKRSTLTRPLWVLSLFFAAMLLCKAQTKGFRMEKVQQKKSYSLVDPFEPPPKSLYQPFSYLGRGRQCFVFLGKDKQTILKLFSHYSGAISTDFAEAAGFKHLIKPREEKMNRILRSGQIARKHLSPLTGVFYTHLSKTDSLLGKIPITCPIGIQHTLDLDKTEFLLQKRGTPLEDHLKSLFEAGKRLEAINSMREILTLIETRSRLGVKKRDGKVLENSGYIDGKPVELDIGSYVMRSRSINPNPHRKAARKAALELLDWVGKHFPEETPYCKEALFDARFL